MDPFYTYIEDLEWEADKARILALMFFSATGAAVIYGKGGKEVVALMVMIGAAGTAWQYAELKKWEKLLSDIAETERELAEK